MARQHRVTGPAVRRIGPPPSRRSFSPATARRSFGVSCTSWTWTMMMDEARLGAMIVGCAHLGLVAYVGSAIDWRWLTPNVSTGGKLARLWPLLVLPFEIGLFLACAPHASASNRLLADAIGVLVLTPASWLVSYQRIGMSAFGFCDQGITKLNHNLRMKVFLVVVVPLLIGSLCLAVMQLGSVHLGRG